MRPTRRRRVRGLVVALAMALAPWTPEGAAGQVRWRDLVVTMGGSLEVYSGNFSAVAVPVVDSAEQVVAVVGEMGVRGLVRLAESRRRSFDVSFDGGMRQAAALGFQRRDYAPREWAGSAAGTFTTSVGSWGSLWLQGGVRSRAVRDQPPTPFYLQPGYTTLQGSAGIRTRSVDGVTFDAQVDLEHADYRAVQIHPQLQLDLLDRTSSGLEAGVTWGGAATVRFFGGFRWTDHTKLGSFDPEDPFRRDHTARVGLEWGYEGEMSAQVGVHGTMNRSNSNRPEYDALSARALVSAPLPRQFSLNLYALLTTKSYVHETAAALLVPGEEADNASIAYLQVGRPVGTNLDAAFRLGWTRAETNLGGAYYRRLGASLRLSYRPTAF